MTVPVYSSHNSALSLWQSAMRTVLSQYPAQQNSTYSGIGAIMRLEGPRLTIDYYQVDSTDYRPGDPPPLTEPFYSETIEKSLATG
jgi:hypothetical protein